MIKQREVTFKDCKVGMEFNVKDRGPMAMEALRGGEVYYPIDPEDTITCVIKKVNESCLRVYCLILVNGDLHMHWSFYDRSVGCYREPWVIQDNLEFKTKKKNNYY